MTATERALLGDIDTLRSALHRALQLQQGAEAQAAHFLTRAERVDYAARELLEALPRVVELLNDPGVGDIDQWKRDCREWTRRSRAAIAKATEIE